MPPDPPPVARRRAPRIIPLPRNPPAPPRIIHLRSAAAGACDSRKEAPPIPMPTHLNRPDPPLRAGSRAGPRTHPRPIRPPRFGRSPRGLGIALVEFEGRIVGLDPPQPPLVPDPPAPTSPSETHRRLGAMCGGAPLPTASPPRPACRVGPDVPRVTFRNHYFEEGRRLLLSK